MGMFSEMFRSHVVSPITPVLSGGDHGDGERMMVVALRRWGGYLLLGLLLSLLGSGLWLRPATAQVDEAHLIDALPVGRVMPEQNAVVFWDNVALDAIRLEPPGPPAVARALAMLHTAQYEAWSQYDATAVGTLLGDRYRQPQQDRTLAHKTEAMAYAAYRVLVDLFPYQGSSLDWAMDAAGFDPTVTTTRPDTPAGIGNLAAAAVLAYRHDDGANQLGDRHPGAYSDYTGYEPVNSPDQVWDLNHWQPLATPNGNIQGFCVDDGTVTVQTYIAPHWGHVTPFALGAGAPIAPAIEPARYPSLAFTRQAREIVEISAHLTPAQKAMAEYWADGPSSEFPPGHWALIAQVVSLRDRHSLDDDARMFFALSNANLDASIVAWGVKRDYDSVRPITAIRQLFHGRRIQAWAGPGQGTDWIDGETWHPYQATCFVSPAFPEFVSGHSTFSAASAEVLKAFTGSDVFGYGDRFYHSEVEYFEDPVDLFWPTFSDAADEAGISRRYGGIHFTDGDLEGRRLGRQIGARVWDQARSFWAGTAAPVADFQPQLADIIATNDITQTVPPRRPSPDSPLDLDNLLGF
jgi:hypothetical protein